jgi:molybdate/tungstate transport system permease protein
MKKIRRSTLTILFSLAALILLLVIIVPLLNTLLGVTSQSFLNVFTDKQVIDSIQLTFACALAAVLIGLLTGVPLAYLLGRFSFPGRDFLQALINLPVIIPHTAAGVALLLVFGRYGVFGKLFAAIGVTFTDQPAGIIVGMLFVSVPFLVNAGREAFAGIDRDLEQASLVDGANHWQMFRWVTLPLCWRGITSGALMMWARGVSEFGAIVILAYHPKVVPVLVFERFQGFGLQAAMPVTILLILVSLFIFILLSFFFFPNKGQN